MKNTLIICLSILCMYCHTELSEKENSLLSSLELAERSVIEKIAEKNKIHIEDLFKAQVQILNRETVRKLELKKIFNISEDEKILFFGERKVMMPGLDVIKIVLCNDELLITDEMSLFMDTDHGRFFYYINDGNFVGIGLKGGIGPQLIDCWVSRTSDAVPLKVYTDKKNKYTSYLPMVSDNGKLKIIVGTSDFDYNELLTSSKKIRLKKK